jgi:Kelch motif
VVGCSGGRSRFVVAFAVAAAMWAWSGGAASAAPVFSTLPAELSEPRYMPAVATLGNGKILVAGGYTGKQRLTTAELFDPGSGTFETLSAETAVTNAETATVTLPNGKVLLAGGYDGTKFAARKTAELFNPATNKFEATGELLIARDAPAAALLPNGKVLIVGGGQAVENFKSAELYDPGTGKFEALSAEMAEGRYAPIAAALPDGNVLVAGGYSGAGEAGAVTTAELYNVTAEKFEALSARMEVPRAEAGAASLANGEVLIAGGYNYVEHNLGSTELFNPKTMAFERGFELNVGRDGPGAARLHNGTILVVGGAYGSEIFKYATSAELATTGPATATTGAASSIGNGTATLNGTVFPPEALTTAYFQYGTTPAYGAATSPQLVAQSLSATGVSAGLAALTPSTAYHFRLVAEDVGGVNYGADQTFTTAKAETPPAPQPAKPAITNARESASRWRAGPKLAHISGRRPPVGTAFSFSLNTRATVSFRFVHVVVGRRVGGHCITKTKRNATHRACRHTAPAATLTFAGHAGSNRVVFQGRVSSSKRLAPGQYTLLITAINAVGQSSPARLTFTIVK